MNPNLQKLSVCAFVCLLAAGCHSSSSTPAPAPAAQTAAAPQPAPVAAAPAAPKPLACTGTANDQNIAEGELDDSLYGLLNSKLGGWSTCTQKKLNKTDDEAVVTFANGATLTIDEYPSSDATQREAVLSAGSAVTREDVIKAMKQGQPQDGCGVDWAKLSGGGPNATGDFKASGTSCTVELHIKMQNGSVVGFGFGIAA